MGITERDEERQGRRGKAGEESRRGLRGRNREEGNREREARV